MPEPRRHPQVVNLDDLTPDEQRQGDFHVRRRRLGPEAGGRALGCSHFELAPGRTTFPFHFHSGFEEALFVLQGAGTLRLGAQSVPVRAGDYVALPAGPQSAHALTNTSSAPLVYLCMSGPATPATMDIVVYPDSKKIAFASGVDPVKGMKGGAWVMKLIREAQPTVGYYDDEPLART